MSKIDLKELRIGNLLTVGNRIVVVSSIFKTHFRCETEEQHSMETSLQLAYRGIPLTEGWLKRFGFENEYESQYRKVYGLSTTGRHWSFNFSKTPKEKDHFEVKGFAIDMGLVKYVHQLQNLYFALTGTELTLADKVE